MVGDIQCRRREFARVTTAYIGGRQKDVTVAGVLAFLGVDKGPMPPCLAETLARAFVIWLMSSRPQITSFPSTCACAWTPIAEYCAI